MATEQHEGYPRTFRARVEVDVLITVNWPTVIDRCVENHDDGGQPQPVGDEGERGWRDVYYRSVATAEDVVEMLAWNWIAHHQPAHELDGWADLKPSWDDPYAAYEIDRTNPYIDVEETTAVPS